MLSFLKRAKEFLRSEDGPTTTEYAALLALVVGMAMMSIHSWGVTFKETFEAVDKSVLDAAGERPAVHPTWHNSPGDTGQQIVVEVLPGGGFRR